MIYDVASRHEQALNPSALTTVTATLHAIAKAVEDCRNAGVNPNSDPAVTLLMRHMAAISPNRADDEVLRSACTRRIKELQRFPTLLALAIRGVEYDVAAKDRFHQDGMAAMSLLATALGLTDGFYQLRSFPGTPDQSGYILLAAADLAVSLQIGARHEGREVAYRAVMGGHEQPNRFAPIRELLKPDRLAERLRQELGLACPADIPAQIAA